MRPPQICREVTKKTVFEFYGPLIIVYLLNLIVSNISIVFVRCGNLSNFLSAIRYVPYFIISFLGHQEKVQVCDSVSSGTLPEGYRWKDRHGIEKILCRVANSLEIWPFGQRNLAETWMFGQQKYEAFVCYILQLLCAVFYNF